MIVVPQYKLEKPATTEIAMCYIKKKYWNFSLIDDTMFKYSHNNNKKNIGDLPLLKV